MGEVATVSREVLEERWRSISREIDPREHEEAPGKTWLGLHAGIRRLSFAMIHGAQDGSGIHPTDMATVREWMERWTDEDPGECSMVDDFADEMMAEIERRIFAFAEKIEAERPERWAKRRAKRATG